MCTAPPDCHAACMPPHTHCHGTCTCVCRVANHRPLRATQSVRVKPEQQKIELTFPLDTSSEYYDPVAGRAIATATVDEDGGDDDDDDDGDGRVTLLHRRARSLAHSLSLSVPTGHFLPTDCLGWFPPYHQRCSSLFSVFPSTLVTLFRTLTSRCNAIHLPFLSHPLVTSSLMVSLSSSSHPHVAGSLMVSLSSSSHPHVAGSLVVSLSSSSHPHVAGSLMVSLSSSSHPHVAGSLMVSLSSSSHPHVAGSLTDSPLSSSFDNEPCLLKAGSAVDADGRRQMFPSGTMDSLTLRSSRVPLKAHYMIGMVAVSHSFALARSTALAQFSCARSLH
jgi:hypothetical protein